MASDFAASVAHGIEAGTQVKEFPPGEGSNEPFVVGDFVFYDTSDNVIQLCGADPALIAGISETDSAEHTLLTPDGKVPVRLFRSSQVVVALGSSTTPAQSHVGDQYGITRNGAVPFNWLLDTAKTGADARVLVVDVDIDGGIFFVQMLNDQLQFAAIA